MRGERHRPRRPDQTRQPGNDSHVLRVHDHRVPTPGRARHALGSAARPGSRRPWAPAAARGMLRRAGERAGLGRIRPHEFRHSFATAVLDASDGNLLVARDAGGWASTAVVDEIYAHVDIHDPVFERALRTVWGQP
ncbi:tyrosine-type recombinase/integrase [Nonomuraea sp. NBC_00507]